MMVPPQIPFPSTAPMDWITVLSPEANSAAETKNAVLVTSIPVMPAPISGTATRPTKAVMIFWNSKTTVAGSDGLSSTW